MTVRWWMAEWAEIGGLNSAGEAERADFGGLGSGLLRGRGGIFGGCRGEWLAGPFEEWMVINTMFLWCF